MQDAHLLKLLITVLKGDFAIVTAGELAKRFPNKNYVRDGLCAVANDCKKLSSAEPLSADTELLQVASPDASNAFKDGMQEMRSGESSVCYLLSREVQEALNLVGKELMVRDRRPLHGTARLLPASACTPVAVGGSAGSAAYGPRSPYPPTLAARGSLPNGAWEPRAQTAPQEPKTVAARPLQ